MYGDLCYCGEGEGWEGRVRLFVAEKEAGVLRDGRRRGSDNVLCSQLLGLAVGEGRWEQRMKYTKN